MDFSSISPAVASIIAATTLCGLKKDMTEILSFESISRCNRRSIGTEADCPTLFYFFFEPQLAVPALARFECGASGTATETVGTGGSHSAATVGVSKGDGSVPVFRGPADHAPVLTRGMGRPEPGGVASGFGVGTGAGIGAGVDGSAADLPRGEEGSAEIGGSPAEMGEGPVGDEANGDAGGGVLP